MKEASLLKTDLVDSKMGEKIKPMPDVCIVKNGNKSQTAIDQCNANKTRNVTTHFRKNDLKQDNKVIKSSVNKNIQKPKSESFQKAAAFWNSPKT